MNKKITVVGTGYVGLSNAILLAQNNQVVALDILEDRIRQINSKQSPIKDEEIERYLIEKSNNLVATTDKYYAYSKAEFIIIATPTDYDPLNNKFNTETIENVIADIIKINPNAVIVIKSTVPVGFTKEINSKFGVSNILFSPEFLREGKALHDNMYPSRIIVGEKSERAEIFASLLKEGAIKKDIPILLTDSTESEAIKLFSNAFLAMRVAYFNEVDNFAITNNINTRDIIDGICMDPRIGDYYNNPSFGYGGYCLPKDTKQLLANYYKTPQRIIGAIVDSNKIRKDFIATEIIKRMPKIVGIYRLNMKSNSDNIRESSIIEIIGKLQQERIEIIIHEPLIKDKEYCGCRIENNLDKFKKNSDLIIANRNNKEVLDMKEKIYSRDIYGVN